MKIQHQVCTLEQGKRLRELGITVWGYFLYGSNGDPIEMWMVEGHEDDFIPAFTAAELGVMLPPTNNEHLSLNWTIFGFDQPKTGRCWYIDRHSTVTNGQSASGSEAWTRATFLIHLLENKLITANEVNKRLAE